MLNTHARVHVNRVADPLGRWLVGLGVLPNAVTLVGTLGTIAAALWFLPRGQLFAGCMVITFFVLFDLIDGAMARAGGGGGTPFGAILDSTCDRLADGAVFCGLVWWTLGAGASHSAGAAALVCLVMGQVVSYIKARAEGIGVVVDGGIVERAERLLLSLVGTGLAGLGVPYALDVALWLLAAGSIWTVVQRLVSARRNSQALVPTVSAAVHQRPDHQRPDHPVPERPEALEAEPADPAP
jgi:CDP-diacylglycerol---glycerol-3-phosphate 3-phosphatidyltransferase